MFLGQHPSRGGVALRWCRAVGAPKLPAARFVFWWFLPKCGETCGSSAAAGAGVCHARFMSNGGRRAELDGVRGIAILLVLVGHADYRLAPLAAAGVALFFTLSGYLITGLLLAEREKHGRLDLRRFYVRRFTRLAPPLFVMLAVMGPLLGASWRDLLGPALWLTNYVDILGGGLPAFGHTWSLAVEEQFYLVWPVALLWLLGRRRPARVLSVTIAALVVWWVALLAAGQFVYSYKALETAGVPILAGALVALARVRFSPAAGVAACAGLAGLTAGLSALDGKDLWGIAPMLSMPLAAALVAAAPGSRWLAWRPLAFCGVASYSLYLWHVPVAWLVGSETIGVAVGSVVGLAAFLAVERPLMAWRGRSVEPAAVPVGRLDGAVGRVVASRG